jgi:hypothetical protein
MVASTSRSIDQAKSSRNLAQSQSLTAIPLCIAQLSPAAGMAMGREQIFLFWLSPPRHNDLSP